MSEIPGFYKKSLKERLDLIAKKSDLTEEEVSVLSREGPLGLEMADKMIENVIGTYSLPIGIGVNFFINGKDY